MVRLGQYCGLEGVDLHMLFWGAEIVNVRERETGNYTSSKYQRGFGVADPSFGVRCGVPLLCFPHPKAQLSGVMGASHSTLFFGKESVGILLSSAKAPTARCGLRQRWYTGRLSKLDRPEIAVPENLTPGLSDAYAAVLYYSVCTVPRPSAAVPPS